MGLCALDLELATKPPTDRCPCVSLPGDSDPTLPELHAGETEAVLTQAHLPLVYVCCVRCFWAIALSLSARNPKVSEDRRIPRSGRCGPACRCASILSFLGDPAFAPSARIGDRAYPDAPARLGCCSRATPSGFARGPDGGHRCVELLLLPPQGIAQLCGPRGVRADCGQTMIHFGRQLPVPGHRMHRRLALPWMERRIQPCVRALLEWRDVTRDSAFAPHQVQFRLDLRDAVRGLTSGFPTSMARRTQRGLVKVLGWSLRGCELLVLSFVLQLGMLPLMARHFHRISLRGPIANMLAVPLSAVIVCKSAVFRIVPRLKLRQSARRRQITVKTIRNKTKPRAASYSWFFLNCAQEKDPTVPPVLVLLVRRGKKRGTEAAYESKEDPCRDRSSSSSRRITKV